MKPIYVIAGLLYMIVVSSIFVVQVNMLIKERDNAVNELHECHIWMLQSFQAGNTVSTDK